jgi:hypothetical protein
MTAPDLSSREREAVASPVLDLRPRIGPSLQSVAPTGLPGNAAASGNTSLGGDTLAIILAMAVLMGALSLTSGELADHSLIQQLSILQHWGGADTGKATDPLEPEVSEVPDEATREPAAEANSPPGDVRVTLVNTGNRPIIEIRIASSADRVWGPDVLGEEVVAEGARFNLNPDAAKGCQFDLLVRFDGGATDERHDLDFCTLSELTVPR